MTWSPGGTHITDLELLRTRFRSVGEGCAISDRASFYRPDLIDLDDNVRIDDFCVISAGGLGFLIERYVHMAPGCVVQAIKGGRIGPFTGFSTGVKIVGVGDDYSGHWMTNANVPVSVRSGVGGMVNIGRHCIFGVNAAVLPSCSIADGTALGAGAVVVHPIYKPDGIHVGVPAKRIRERETRMYSLARSIPCS